VENFTNLVSIPTPLSLQVSTTKLMQKTQNLPWHVSVGFGLEMKLNPWNLAPRNEVKEFKFKVCSIVLIQRTLDLANVFRLIFKS